MVKEVFIGKRDHKEYVDIIAQIRDDATEEVLIKARGKYITKAVNVAEIAKRTFLKGYTSEGIEISTEEFVDETTQKTVKVSTILIPLRFKA